MADIDDTPDDIDPIDPRDEEKPRGRTSLWNIILICFNIVAMLGFGAMLYIDMTKRLEWAEAYFMRQLALVGLPVDKEDNEAPELATQVKHDLDPQMLKEAYDRRNVNLKGDKITPVHENFHDHVRYDDITESVLNRYYSLAGVTTGKKVWTLKEEVDGLKSNFPDRIDKAAEYVVTDRKDQKPDEKRALIRKILFPQAVDGYLVTPLEKKIRETPDAKLDELLAEVTKRRILFDILMPMEIFRPSAPNDEKLKRLVQRVCKLNNKGEFEVPTADMVELFKVRCDDVLADRHWLTGDAKRDYAEKRRAIAFLLLTTANVETPGDSRIAPNRGDEPAKKGEEPPKKGEEPPKKGEEPPKSEGEKPERTRPFRAFVFPDLDEKEGRVAAVCGLFYYNQACEDLALVYEIMEKQSIDAINRDRGNYVYPLELRIYDPPLFAKELVSVMEQMKFVEFPSDKAKDNFKKTMLDSLKAMENKVDSLDALLTEVHKNMDGSQILLKDPELPAAGDKQLQVNRKFFDLEVASLLNRHAEGFLGKYRLAIRRIQDISRLIRVQEMSATEQKALADKQEGLLNERIATEKELREKLLKARAETRRLALELEILQQELFEAQKDLSGAHGYNVYLDARLRELERKLVNQTKGGKLP
jgi:hypothetical protein